MTARNLSSETSFLPLDGNNKKKLKSLVKIGLWIEEFLCVFDARLLEEENNTKQCREYNLLPSHKMSFH